MENRQLDEYVQLAKNVQEMRQKSERSNYVSQRGKIHRKESQGQSLQALHRKKDQDNKFAQSCTDYNNYRKALQAG